MLPRNKSAGRMPLRGKPAVQHGPKTETPRGLARRSGQQRDYTMLHINYQLEF